VAGCSDLELFFDDELETEAQAAAFRDHLASCARCQEKLDGLMQEMVAVSRTETSVVADAKLEFSKAFLAIEKKHKLTYGEMFSILGDYMQNLAKYLIRSERHPDDPDKGGDEA